MAPEKLRVGSVPYLVGRPLDLGLDAEPAVELVRRQPAELVRGLRAGELDVALVSSIELFRRPGYRYLDRLAVAGESEVTSVQLFLRRPVAELRRVALDPASRTSAVLARIVLERLHGVQPEWFEPPDGGDPRAAEACAWLRIGDAALRELHAADPPTALNPSAEWRRLTGLPFVFACWIVAPGVRIEPWVAAFERSRARGAAATAELARAAAVELDLPAAVLATYLRTECLFELLPERFSRALLRFRDEAARLDQARADLAPAAVPTASVDR